MLDGFHRQRIDLSRSLENCYSQRGYRSVGLGGHISAPDLNKCMY